MFSTGLLHFFLKILSTLSIVVVSYKKLSQFVKNFLLTLFINSFDGKMLDKSYDLEKIL